MLHGIAAYNKVNGIYPLIKRVETAVSGVEICTSKIDRRAQEITRLAKDALFGQPERKAMIGGALWMMSTLESHLRLAGIQPMFAFSKRESVERVVDGKTVKTNVFKHVGFVEA